MLPMYMMTLFSGATPGIDAGRTGPFVLGQVDARIDDAHPVGRNAFLRDDNLLDWLAQRDDLRSVLVDSAFDRQIRAKDESPA